MKTLQEELNEYDVTIEAVVRKTIRISAISNEAAVELAHQCFSVSNTDEPEKYEENLLNVHKVLTKED